MGKKGLKKRKKLIALLSAAAAVLSLAGGGIGAAFAMAAQKKAPSPSPSSSHLKVETQDQKKAQKEQEAKAESALLKKRQTSTLLSSPRSNSTLDSLSPLPASALAGDLWSGGILSSSPTPVSSPQAAFSSPAETRTLSLSSPLVWLPFDFQGNNASVEEDAGWVDQEQIKSWVESGNYASEAMIGFQNTGQGITSSEAAYKAPTESQETSLFGGVNPDTGEPVNVTSNGEYSQPFEQYVISLCMQNTPVSQGGQGVAAALGLSSSKPTSSQCLQAFQKNAEEQVTVGGTSYDLLSYQGLSAFLKVLVNSVPSNGSAYNGYFGPGVSGPVTTKVSLSGTLLYLLSLDLAYPQADPAYFFYDLTAFVPPSYQGAQMKGTQPPWEFQQFPAHFKAYSESGQPLKQVKIALKVDSYPWPGKLTGEYIGQYIWPAYWDPSDPNNPAVDELPESFPLASSSYRYFGWTNTGGQDPGSGQFTLSSDPGAPGSFTIPNLVPGTYTVTVLGEGSEYSWPSFNITLGLDGTETFTSSNDPDGFVDASQETVVTDSSNPSVGVLNSEGELEKDPNPSHEESQGNTFSYQLSAYLPFPSPFSVEIDPGTGYGIELQEGKVAGIPISSLEEHGASLSANKLTLNSSAIAYIEQNGFMPASASLPLGSEKLSTSSGSQRVFSVEFPAYLTSSFKAGDAVSYSLSYSNSAPGLKGQTITGSFEGMSAAEPWFRAISEDGKPLTTLSLQYMEVLATGATGATGTLTLSSPSSSPGLFILPASLIPYMQDANSLYVSVQEGSYFQSYGSPDSGQSYQEVFYMTTSSAGGGIQFKTWSNGLYDFGRFSDPSTRTVLVGAANPSSQLLSPSGTVDSSSYPTATVGESNTFTYQLQSVLPLSGLLQVQQSPSYLPSSIPGITIRGASGEEILQNLSDVKVDGIAASTMESHGMIISFEQEEGEPELIIAFASSFALSYIEQNGFMPATSSSPAASTPLDGNRVLSVTFKAYLSPTQGESKSPTWFLTAFLKGSSGEIIRSFPGTYLSLPQIYTNGPSDNSLPSSLSASDPSSATGLWFENTFENPKDNNEGCSIADSDSYSPTEFTVQNPSGQYLAPVEDNGTFEGWEWSGSPYDFKERNSSGDFEWGGLADGTYTVKSVEYPSSLSFTSSLSYSSPQILEGKGTASVTWGHPNSSGGRWSFNWYISGGYLDYSDIRGDETDWSGPPPLPTSNLTANASSACYITPGGPAPAPVPPAPSHLPFTGGKGVLGLSLASSFLFLLGAGVWWGLKKKRKNSNSGKHGF